MHRLLVEPSELSRDTPALSKDALNHLKVLRPKEGEAIELFDGCGCARPYVWKGGALVAQTPGVAPTAAPRPHSLVLFACVTKGSRWDWTIEKSTELGVTRLVPVISERTIVRLAPEERAAKAVRWRRIAEDAARQSDALWLPEICEPVSFADSLALVSATTCFVGALTNPPSPPLIAAISSVRFPSPPALYIGPEGDFTPDELAALIAVAHPVSFGPTILRAETAAIFGVSVLAAALASNPTQGNHP